jgi:predicted DNA-binding antitoxin AbrB/MazE fold protein
MNQTIPAIFDSGVFRPLQPVNLADGTQVQVQVQEPEQVRTDKADEATRNSWNDYLDRMESLPGRSPQDGLTNRDHDRVIYGG